MALTYGELRSNAEQIADAALKARVLRGIEVLNAWDPNWAEYIDPSELLMSSPTACVLGQAFDSVREVSEDEIKRFDEAQPDLSGQLVGRPMVAVPGYFKGLAILNGDALLRPSDYAFDTSEETYLSLDEAWLTVLGVDDEPASAAVYEQEVYEREADDQVGC